LRTNYLIKSSLFACLVLPITMRADIVVNGGFETNSGGSTFPSTASPWVVTNPNTGADDSTGVCTTSTCGPGPRITPFGPHSGDAYFYGGAWTGSTNNLTRGTVSQTVTTTPLLSYQISFWLAQPVAGTINSWALSWDGIPETLPIDGINRNVPAFAYTQIFFVVRGITGSDTLKFSFYDNAAPGEVAGYELDDVSIDPLTAGQTGVNTFPPVPEPSSVVQLATMLFGVTALIGVFRKKRA
jgi:hypothetical protein